MKKTLSIFLWFAVALLGAWAYITLALHRGEHINSAFILVAALCTYAIGYRFYSKWIAARVLALDDRRATPCEIHEETLEELFSRLMRVRTSTNPRWWYSVSERGR